MKCWNCGMNLKDEKRAGLVRRCPNCGVGI